jgi:multisubunit Na+/H+ antiporter MnhC subunit
VIVVLELRIIGGGGVANRATIVQTGRGEAASSLATIIILAVTAIIIILAVTAIIIVLDLSFLGSKGSTNY